MPIGLIIATVVLGLPNLFALWCEIVNWRIVWSWTRRRGVRTSGILLVPLLIGLLDMLFLPVPPLRWIGIFGIVLAVEHVLVVAIFLSPLLRRGSDFDG